MNGPRYSIATAAPKRDPRDRLVEALVHERDRDAEGQRPEPLLLRPGPKVRSREDHQDDGTQEESPRARRRRTDLTEDVGHDRGRPLDQRRARATCTRHRSRLEPSSALSWLNSSPGRCGRLRAHARCRRRRWSWRNARAAMATPSAVLRGRESQHRGTGARPTRPRRAALAQRREQRLGERQESHAIRLVEIVVHRAVDEVVVVGEVRRAAGPSHSGCAPRRRRARARATRGARPAVESSSSGTTTTKRHSGSRASERAVTPPRSSEPATTSPPSNDAAAFSAWPSTRAPTASGSVRSCGHRRGDGQRGRRAESSRERDLGLHVHREVRMSEDVGGDTRAEVASRRRTARRRSPHW